VTDHLTLPQAGLPEAPTSGQSLRPIHYLGGKSRLLEQIAESVDEADPSRGRILDLFAGSGVVSARFASERDVVAADVQEYSRVLCSALLMPSAPSEGNVIRAIAAAADSPLIRKLLAAIRPLAEYEEWALRAADHDPDLLCALVETGSLAASLAAPSDGTRREPLTKALRAARELFAPVLLDHLPWAISYHYGGVYFSYEQATDFDLLLAATDHIRPTDRDTWLAAILSTASEVVTSVGNQFAQPVRPRTASGQPKPQAIRTICRRRRSNVMTMFSEWLERYREVSGSNRNHRAVQTDYREYLAAPDRDITVVYADPPYTRDHYSRFYHVLETMARRDSPGVSTMRLSGRTLPSRGIYRSDRHQSPFCIKSEAPSAFAELFAGVRAMDVPLIVSYSPYSEERPSHPRLLTIGEVKRLAQHHFSSVDVITIDEISHSKFNTTHRNFERTTGAEVLVSCRL
jgi:adenine-specific DNA-methyltransferase